MNTDFEDDTDDAVTYVTVRTITGDVGEWDDPEAAEEAWQDYLHDELYKRLSKRYPDAIVTIEVSLAGGSWAYLDTDAHDLDDDELSQLIDDIFGRFCNP